MPNQLPKPKNTWIWKPSPTCLNLYIYFFLQERVDDMLIAPFYLQFCFKTNDILFDVAMTRCLLPSFWILEAARKLSESWVLTFKIKNYFNHFSIKKSKIIIETLINPFIALKYLKNAKITWNHKTSQWLIYIFLARWRS